MYITPFSLKSSSLSHLSLPPLPSTSSSQLADCSGSKHERTMRMTPSLVAAYQKAHGPFPINTKVDLRSYEDDRFIQYTTQRREFLRKNSQANIRDGKW